MNIGLLKLKDVAKELRGIRLVLTRIADYMEMELVDKGYAASPRDEVKASESSLGYTDELEDWGRENIKNFDELISKVDE